MLRTGTSATVLKKGPQFLILVQKVAHHFIERLNVSFFALLAVELNDTTHPSFQVLGVFVLGEPH